MDKPCKLYKYPSPIQSVKNSKVGLILIQYLSSSLTMAHQNEFLKKLTKKTSSYSVALMNDTKWRELLTLLDKYQLSFQIAMVWNENTFVQEQGRKRSENREDYLFESYTADVYAGGPIYYQAIYALRIEKFEEKHNPQTGMIIQDDTKFIHFFESLSKLGQFPISDSQDHIFIEGYRL